MGNAYTGYKWRNINAYIENRLDEGFEEKTIDLYYSGISDDMVPELCKWLDKIGDNADYLILSSCNITSSGASVLFNYLKTNTHIVGLNLGGTYVGDECMADLGKLLNQNAAIRQIGLHDTYVSDAGLKTLATTISGGLALRDLNLASNARITDYSIETLSEFIRISGVESLDLTETSISDPSCFEMALLLNNIINGNSILEFSGRELDDEKIQVIADCIRNYGENIKEINLWSNNLSSKGAIVLFQSLMPLSYLSIIGVNRNKVDDEAMPILAELIQKSKKISSIDIGCNKITDEGVAKLRDGIIANKSLQTLVLSSNEGVTDESESALKEAVRKSSLKKVSLWSTSISDFIAREIQQIAETPIEERESEE